MPLTPVAHAFVAPVVRVLDDLRVAADRDVGAVLVDGALLKRCGGRGQGGQGRGQGEDGDEEGREHIVGVER